MNYVGIDWAYGQAAFCAMGEGGEIAAEGLIPANEDGLARLVLKLGTEASGCVEMMSGAVWVRDRLEAAGWGMKVAHAGKVRDVAPLACKTDKVDARVLAELCRRDLVPELWLPSGEDRALRSGFADGPTWSRSAPLPATGSLGCSPSSGCGSPTPGFVSPTGSSCFPAAGCRRSGGPRSPSCSSWPRRWTAGSPRSSVSSPRSRGRIERARLLRTMPGVGPLLGLTFAAEIGEVSRFRSPGKLIAYAGLAPRVSQSGERSQTGALSKAGSRTLRWAAVEAANQAWRPSNPWHRHYLRVTARHGKNPAKSSVARKLLIAAWHMLSRDEPFKPPAEHCPGELLLLSDRPTVLHGIERPRQLPGTICAPSAEREMSTPQPPAGSGTSTPSPQDGHPLDSRGLFKEKGALSIGRSLLAHCRSAVSTVSRRSVDGVVSAVHPSASWLDRDRWPL